MAWISKVKVSEATGLLKDLLDASIKRAGRVYEIVHIQSLNPPVMAAALEVYKTIMYGPSPLSRRQREMIATIVSSLNHCHY